MQLTRAVPLALGSGEGTATSSVTLRSPTSSSRAPAACWFPRRAARGAATALKELLLHIAPWTIRVQPHRETHASKPCNARPKFVSFVLAYSLGSLVPYLNPAVAVGRQERRLSGSVS